jgi:GcrA cell cycle regulator
MQADKNLCGCQSGLEEGRNFAAFGNTALALHPFVIEAAAPQTVRDVVVPIFEPVSIVELRESMCRWPIGDPAQSEFRFCGAKKRPGEGPYCACHAGIAYQTQHDRRRERRSQGRPSA